ncbi:MAG: hypothetical protein ABR978_03565, partial [Dehalococcoidia bacterium]
MAGSASEEHQKASFSARVAMWSARHRRAIALGWLAVIAAAFAACSMVAPDNNIALQVPGESGKALNLYRDRFGSTQVPAQEIVVFSSASRTVDDPVYKQTVVNLMTQLTELRWSETQSLGGTTIVSSRRIVSGTLTHYDAGAPREASPFVAPSGSGGDVTFAIVSLQGDAIAAQDHVQPVINTVQAAA